MVSFDLTWVIAGIIAVSLIIYVVLAGADFGGGVWDLLASGPGKDEQRKAIGRAMGPVWEANHVWLILVVVLLFTCFPTAFAVIFTALVFPLTLGLLGIVLRGACFTFRAHAREEAGAQLYFGTIFGVASLITPFFFGCCIGALGSGAIHIQNDNLISDYFTTWLAPFPIAVGFMSIAFCAFLAAVYLTLETAGDLQEDFRNRAVISGVVAAAIATITLPLGLMYAPVLTHQLILGRGIPFVIGTIVIGFFAMLMSYLRHYYTARVATVAEVACAVLGWAFAQAPYIVIPDITIQSSAAPQATLETELWVLGIGSVFLIPSLILLFAVFKGRNPAVEENTAKQKS